MPDARHNAVLNDLLICLYRSLLQYTIECWPWTDDSELEQRQAIEELATRQRAQVGRIVELLESRQYPIDFGQYPDWSELHYVALEYLLAKLIEDEANITASVERAQAALAEDTQGRHLAAEILLSEQRHFARLKELAAAQNRQTPV